jgi:hypothetical protein
VEFPNEDAQKDALKHHKNEMGERYIELFVSSKVNMVQVSASRLLAAMHPETHLPCNCDIRHPM